MSPGEIYVASEILSTVQQQTYTTRKKKPKLHKLIVVSREEFNRGRYAIVIPVTTKKIRERTGLPNCVLFKGGEFGFGEDSIAQAELMTIILKAVDIDWTKGIVGKLDDLKMRQVMEACKHVVSVLPPN